MAYRRGCGQRLAALSRAINLLRRLTRGASATLSARLWNAAAPFSTEYDLKRNLVGLVAELVASRQNPPNSTASSLIVRSADRSIASAQLATCPSLEAQTPRRAVVARYQRPVRGDSLQIVYSQTYL
ncbi:unnamed protein product [Chrysodeixis includens]|uniref:Uncharacterized protein n=1 Tax=Chrysodeixis includens TaxID=689277 RepID=A0A9N8L1J7_CHRIL|nr:unnamed protein product [Chrysodeixis includens]